MNLIKDIHNLFSLSLGRLTASNKVEAPVSSQVLFHQDLDLSKNSRLCFFAHFGYGKGLSKSDLDYLKALHECGFAIAFCSSHQQLSNDAISELKKYCFLIMSKENRGLDFTAWSLIHHQIALQSSNYLANLNGLVLCNDSVFGPLSDLKAIFERPDLKKADFWGLTDSHELNWHLQSYFLAFNSAVLSSEVFKKFLDDVVVFKNKRRLIYQYELGLTKILQQAGFIAKAAFPYSNLISHAPQRTSWFRHRNPTIFYWDILMTKLNFPFVKRSVVRDNPQNVLSYDSSQSLIEKISPQ